MPVALGAALAAILLVRLLFRSTLEACLRRWPGLTFWAVTAIWFAGIVAFVAAGSRSLDSAREWLAQRLPPYMVPSRLIEVDRLPLNTNGKIDRSALRARLEEEQ